MLPAGEPQVLVLLMVESINTITLILNLCTMMKQKNLPLGTRKVTCDPKIEVSGESLYIAGELF
jgi:hypothetical protein